MAFCKNFIFSEFLGIHVADYCNCDYPLLCNALEMEKDPAATIILNFLPIQDYVRMWSVSKAMWKKCQKLKKLRYPFITAFSANYKWHRPTDNAVAMLKEQYDIDWKYSTSRSHPAFVHVVKQLKRLSGFELFAVPWKFRKCVEISIIDGEEWPTFNEENFIYIKCVKYENRELRPNALKIWLAQARAAKDDWFNAFNDWLDPSLPRRGKN